jgi:hypothetical protein
MKIYAPDWVKPEYLAVLGYKDDNHADGADNGYYKYVSHGGIAKHREGRECEQPLWDGKRQIWFNCSYAVEDKAVYCKIYEDAGTRTVFNGVIMSAEQLNLILSLVE